MNAWNIIVLNPILNVLVVLYSVLLHNFGLSVIVLTIVVRLVTMPLTIKQLRSTKKLQDLQPKLAEIQKKFAKNKEKLAQAQMQLYRESGISPVGCVVPMLIQMPVWVALYQGIRSALPIVPEDFLNLSGHLYNWTIVNKLVPLNADFLWLNLAKPDGTLILPILVGASMWVQQKMITTPSPDPRQQSMSSMMQWMMPVMFTLFSFSFPSGLALYWFVSNVFGILIQYFFIGGWGGLSLSLKRPPAKKPLPAKKGK